ncbi:jg8061 [Pararge aegeria aegeria]|uniref:Jg8061 protein n=1 Tax=Pararge aegeria aegeria TaxID=348720 RepID=A0A8S4QLS9_9NEOP|nr:jg8061 [Pararge aegeria aegeria]
MDSTRKPQPLVPGRPAIPGSGSGYGNGGASGVKNLRQSWNGCHALVSAALVEYIKRHNLIRFYGIIGLYPIIVTPILLLVASSSFTTYRRNRRLAI